MVEVISSPNTLALDCNSKAKNQRMLLTQIDPLLERVYSSVLAYLTFYLVTFLCVVFSLTGLLGWRFWRFTLHLFLHPSEPKEPPYWIPFLGHAIGFIKNQDNLFNHARQYFKDTRQPFAITLGREKLYILTAYQDVIAAYKNTTTLSYGRIIRGLVCYFGISEDGAESIYAPSPSFAGEIQRLNPQNKSLFDLKSDFYHIQLQHPKQLGIMQNRFLALINDAMKFEALPKDIQISSFESNKGNVSLYKLCQQIFVKAGIQAFLEKKCWKWINLFCTTSSTSTKTTGWSGTTSPMLQKLEIRWLRFTERSKDT